MRTLDGTARYAFDNGWERARQRLTYLEIWLDPGTIRHLTTLGVGPGWRCLEVGAGGGSIVTWLSQRVGETGGVLATDINPRFIAPLDLANLAVSRHDITAGSPARRAFDLVHERLVLMHLPDRQRALRNMVDALRPGGWLLVEEMDFGSFTADRGCNTATRDLFLKMGEAHHTVMRAHGMDPRYGRDLLRDLRSVGLKDVDAEGRVSICEGGSAGAVAWRLTFEQLRAEIVEADAATDEEISRFLALLDDPAVSFESQVTMAAWGRCPERAAWGRLPDHADVA
jgi:SAM-dependent methyltransferase